MTIAIAAGLLVMFAVYLIMKRELLRIILGFIFLGHAANLVLFSAGGTSRRGEPIGVADNPSLFADPLPQAFVLTAIVIAFSITMVLLALSVTGQKDDLVSISRRDDSIHEPEAINPSEDKEQAVSL